MMVYACEEGNWLKNIGRKEEEVNLFTSTVGGSSAGTTSIRWGEGGRLTWGRK